MSSDIVLPFIFSWLKVNSQEKIAKKLAKATSFDHKLSVDELHAKAAELEALLTGSESAKEVSSSEGSTSDSSSSPDDIPQSTKSNKKKRKADDGQITEILAITKPADDQSDQPVAKKSRIEIDPSSTQATVVEQTPANVNIHPDRLQHQQQNVKKQNVPFRRVRAEDVQLDARLANNSYDAKPGNSNDYGAKASRDLIVTRGDKFRKEKGKKKRGSYKGGDITMESHSIKFDD